MDPDWSTLAYWTLAFVVGTLGATRMTRLVVDDAFPPIVKIREWYITKAGPDWGLLLECPWCFGFWIAGTNTLWAFVSDLHWTWWFVNLWLAASMLVGMISVRDIPPDQRG